MFAHEVRRRERAGVADGKVISLVALTWEDVVKIWVRYRRELALTEHSIEQRITRRENYYLGQ
jgi:hypothetical protein